MILQELIKGIMDEWDDSYPMYYNHCPQGVEYPLVVFNIIDSPRTYAMGDSSLHTDPFQYTKSRISFTVYGNENQMNNIMTISQNIENIYKFQKLSFGNGVTGIFSWVADQRIGFFEKGDKVWSVTTDMIFMVGE